MRFRGGDSSPATGSRSPAFAQSVRRFDVYTKVQHDLKVQTESGGLISLASLITMAILFFSELDNYLTVEVVDHVKVDTALNEKLPIGVNITFPHLRCDEVSFDSLDATGESQIGVSETLVMESLDIDGRPSADVVGKDGDCLSCLEAGEYYPDICCNSCQQLKDAYRSAGLPYFHVLDTAEQCKREVGCQVHGDILVSKVSGNVHVALGRTRMKDGVLVHEFNMQEVSDGFNTSHIVNRMAFGPQVAGIVSPLEGISKIVKHGAYMFHYYVKLVPTLFEGREGTVYTHQYSVSADTDKNAMVKKGELLGLPGVFFVYEFTPFMVHKVEKVVPLSHFLTSVCAIIGGVFTVAGMLDAILYRGYRGIKTASSKRLPN